MSFADGDGFLDIIIYIVIMVVGLAASAYRNYTKRKEAEKKREQGELYTDFPEVEQEPIFDEEIYNEEPEYTERPYQSSTHSDAPEITGANQPVIPEPVVQTISNESQLDRPFSEVEVQESLIDTVPGNIYEQADEKKVEISQKLVDDISSGDLSQNEIHDSDSEEDVSEEFNAKQAIIYSEIINRKYI
jgi:hypothetical protein